MPLPGWTITRLLMAPRPLAVPDLQDKLESQHAQGYSTPALAVSNDQARDYLPEL
jgi:hypothetical protein